jgi:hypothetical protein
MRAWSGWPEHWKSDHSALIKTASNVHRCKQA